MHRLRGVVLMATAEIAHPAVAAETDVVRVPFHGDDILCIDEDGQPALILKSALETIGVDYWTQVEKLRGRSWARTGQRLVRQSDGRAREVITCDVRTFLMLLATIDERRVGKDVKPKLIAYQAEVADAIEAYWTQGGAINPRATREQLDAIAETAQRQMGVLRLMDGIVDARWLEAKAREVAARALGEAPEQDPNTRFLTVSDYLEEQDVADAAVRKLRGNFGKRLKAAFIRRHGETPGTAPRIVDGATRDVAVYTEADRDLFEQVWAEIGGA